MRPLKTCLKRLIWGPTVFAEASIIPRTVFDLGLWINVQEWTLLVATLTCECGHTNGERLKSVMRKGGNNTGVYKLMLNTQSKYSQCADILCVCEDKRTKLGVEVALGHLGHVVFMEELALVSLLTQSSEPVLTHHRLLSTDVTKRTHAT